MRGSVSNQAAVRRALEGVDVLFHQAAYQDYMTDFSRNPEAVRLPGLEDSFGTHHPAGLAKAGRRCDGRANRPMTARAGRRGGPSHQLGWEDPAWRA